MSTPPHNTTSHYTSLTFSIRTTAINTEPSTTTTASLTMNTTASVEAFTAVQMNDVQLLHRVLQHGCSSNRRNDDRKTLLVFGCELGHGLCCRVLLERGAAVGLKDGSGRSALWVAAYEGVLCCVVLCCVVLCCVVLCCVVLCCVVLCCAVLCCVVLCCVVLCCVVLCCAVLCCAVLCCVVLCCVVLCCVELCCVVLCCVVLCCAVLCCVVLCCAVLCCVVLCCAVLCCAVLCYADILKHIDSFMCYTVGFDAIVELLLLYDANPCQRCEKYETTALHVAAQEGHVGVVKLLVEVELEGLCVLYCIVLPFLISYLSKHCIDKIDLVDAIRTDGCTALHLGCKRGNLEIVQFLLQANASLHLKDHEGVRVYVRVEEKTVKC